MWPLRHFCPPYIYHQSVELYAGLLHKAKRVCVGGGSAAWVRPTNNKYIAERTSNSIYSFLVNGSKKVNEVAVYVYPQKTLRIFIYIPAILIYYSHAGLEQGKKRALYYCLGNTVTLYILHEIPWWTLLIISIREFIENFFFRFAGDESAKWEIISRFASSSVYGVCVIASFIFPSRTLLATRQRHESLLSLFL